MDPNLLPWSLGGLATATAVGTYAYNWYNTNVANNPADGAILIGWAIASLIGLGGAGLAATQSNWPAALTNVLIAIAPWAFFLVVMFTAGP